MTDPPGDRELWRRAAAGEPDCFGEIFDRHAGAVHAYLRARLSVDERESVLGAGDLVSVVFLEAWRRRRDVELVEESALPWLLGVARRVLLHRARSVRRHRTALARLPHDASPAAEGAAGDVADDVARRVDGERRLAAVLVAFRRLRPAEQEVLTLCVWVRFLPAGTPSEVTFRMESSCPLPERDDRPVMRPDAVWTLARVGSVGTVDAVVTLFRGLPEGISQQVADRTSQRLPTDGNDPGTVLDPPYEAVQVRGTTGTLVEQRDRFEGTRVIWTEPSRGTWSVQAFGLSTTDVLAIAGRLRVVGDHLEPGELRVFSPAEVRGGDLTLPVWYLLEVPARPEVIVGEVVRTPALRTRMPGRDPGTTLFTSVQAPFPGSQDWRVLVRPGDEIVEVAGLDALVSRDAVTGLLFDLPTGAQAGMSLRSGATLEPVSTRAAVDALRAAAESLTSVPFDDPRLRNATVGE